MDLAKNLKIESVARLQPPPPVVLSQEDTVRQAVARMQEQRVGCALVCEQGKLVGIFTERDLLQRVLGIGEPLSLKLKDCMTPQPMTVEPTDSVATALRKMQEGGHRHLPVVDARGQAVGVLSVKRIIRYLVEHFPATVYNQPPNPSVVQQRPEGA